jgi:hypothetical protein
MNESVIVSGICPRTSKVVGIERSGGGIDGRRIGGKEEDAVGAAEALSAAGCSENSATTVEVARASAETKTTCCGGGGGSGRLNKTAGGGELISKTTSHRASTLRTNYYPQPIN